MIFLIDKERLEEYVDELTEAYKNKCFDEVEYILIDAINYINKIKKSDIKTPEDDLLYYEFQETKFLFEEILIQDFNSKQDYNYLIKD